MCASTKVRNVSRSRINNKNNNNQTITKNAGKK